MFKETKSGFKFESDTHLCFFGNKNSDLDYLKKEFSNYTFKEIRQTHSDILVQSYAGSPLCEGDAQWTSENNLALYIKTADCIPALVINNENNDILAIHAGWRGVANQIILKSLRQLNWKNINVFWGPHILQKSFEVQEEVKNQIENSSYVQSEEVFKKIDGSYYIDLISVAQSQANQNTQACHQAVLIDTKTNLSFHSFRRDQTNAGRNISFIVKK